MTNLNALVVEIIVDTPFNSDGKGLTFTKFAEKKVY